MAAAERARPSEAIEDYAKAIYSLARQGDGTVATNALAERLGVTRPRSRRWSRGSTSAASWTTSATRASR